MSWVAAVFGLLGAVLGVLSGAFVEALKLRFAAKARRRDERVDRSGQVVKAARDTRDALTEVKTIFELGQRQRPPASFSSWDRGQQAMDEARKAGSALRGATALVELSGPDALASAARAMRNAAAPLLLEPPSTEEVFDASLSTFDVKLDEFIAAARRHVG
jgi:hypothetical protein